MPKGSEELTNARKEEIIDACAALYETVGFKDITIREIGERTSFTRTSIYNYFQTKEEIFLALLQREHESWIAELDDLIRQNARLSVEEFADRLAGTLERRGGGGVGGGVGPRPASAISRTARMCSRRCLSASSAMRRSWTAMSTGRPG